MKTLALILALSALSGSALASEPAMKPVAVCRDGKTYYNATGDHRGACSGHQGVLSWSDGTPVKAKKGSSYR